LATAEQKGVNYFTGSLATYLSYGETAKSRREITVKIIQHLAKLRPRKYNIGIVYAVRNGQFFSGRPVQSSWPYATYV